MHQNGWTSLICSTKNGHNGIVAQLIAAGADANYPNTKDNYNTALIYAEKWGYEGIIGQLETALANSNS